MRPGQAARLAGRRPTGLPRGQIHADLFPDNVFFLHGPPGGAGTRVLSGLIDFYFACTDLLAYDLGVCLNAWCFEPRPHLTDLNFNVTKAKLMLDGYETVRRLQPAERQALPVLPADPAVRLGEHAGRRAGHPQGPARVSPPPASPPRRVAGSARPVSGETAEAGPAEVEVWTDGGCKPNPGPGGWAVLLRFRGHERELSGGEPATTNNRMELTAAAEALEALTRPCRIALHTDSEYVRNGVTRWSTGWVRRNWRTAGGDPVANMDLWRRVLEAARRHEVSWHWVRGHAGNVDNDRVDRLATAARLAVERGVASEGVKSH